MLVMIDGPTINRFIADAESFRKCADDRFHELDGNGDGLLSREDIQRGIFPGSVGDVVFEKFDVDGNGWIDQEEFRPMMTEILMAMGRGIGSTPVMIGVEEDSVLMKAYENEVARMERKSEEVTGSKKGIKRGLKKKRSMKILEMCGCSTRYLGED